MKADVMDGNNERIRKVIEAMAGIGADVISITSTGKEENGELAPFRTQQLSIVVYFKAPS